MRLELSPERAQEVTEALAWVTRACSGKRDPELAGVTLMLHDGELTMKATDHEALHSVTIEVEHEVSWTATVSGARLSALMTSFPVGKPVTFNETGLLLNLSCGRSEYKLPLMRPMEYRHLEGTTLLVRIDPDALLQAVNGVRRHVSSSMEGGVPGVLLDGRENGFHVVATQGVTMGVERVEAVVSVNPHWACVPLSKLTDALRDVESDDLLTLGVILRPGARGPVTGALVLSSGPRLAVVRAYEETKATQWRKVVGAWPDHHEGSDISIPSVSELASALRRLRIVCDDENPDLWLGSSDGGSTLTLSAGNGDRELLEAKVPRDLNLALGLDLLLSIVNAAPSTAGLDMLLPDKRKVILRSSAEGRDALHLIAGRTPSRGLPGGAL